MHKKRSPCFTSPSVPPIQATGKNEHIWVREKTPRKVFSCQSPEKSSLLWIPPSPPVCENFVIDFTSKSSLALIFMVKISFGPYLTVIKRVACLRWPDLDFVCVFVRLPKEYSVGHNRRSSRLSIVFPWTTPHHPQPPPHPSSRSVLFTLAQFPATLFAMHTVKGKCKIRSALF